MSKPKYEPPIVLDLDAMIERLSKRDTVKLVRRLQDSHIIRLEEILIELNRLVLILSPVEKSLFDRIMALRCALAILKAIKK